MFAPTIGVEYFISNHFSLSGECALMTVRNQEAIEEMNYSNGEENKIGNITTTAMVTMPKLIFRFYF